MTTLVIIPNYADKRLEFNGTVAAGEHVSVTIVGGSEWVGTGSALRLRVLFGGKMVAVFPYWTDENEDDWPDEVVSADAWDTTGEDPTCTLVLNTIQAEKTLRRGGECLWILDDVKNHTLYGMGVFYVEPWPKNRPSDVPYNLDGYPDFVEEAKAAIQTAAQEAQAAAGDARDASDEAATAAESAQAAISNARDAIGEATAAKEAVEAALTVEGRFVDSASQYADSAANSAVAAAGSAAAAGAAQIAAETAQGKAEDAQIAAETAQAAAEGALEDKADKVSSPTEGNFAALDDEGNLTDSGKNAGDFADDEHSHAMSDVTGLVDALNGKGDADTLANVVTKVATLIGNASGDDARSVREIAALAIAAWAAGADTRYDTLKEIADWILNDTTGAAKMANDIANLKTGKVDVASGKGLSTNDYTDADKAKLTGVAVGAKDNVVEAIRASAFPATGEAGKIYVAKDINKTFRWNGSQYVMVGGNGVQSDWNQTNSFAADYIKNKPDVTSCLMRAEAVDGFTKWEVDTIASGKTLVSCEWHEGTAPDRGWVVSMIDGGASISLLIAGEPDATSLTYPDLIALSRVRIHPAIDSALSPTSENPVQNKVVKAALDGKRGVLDLAVYAEQYAWTFSDGVDHGVLIQDTIAAGWGLYPDRPWVVTGADFNTLPPSECFFATKAEAEAVTEFFYYLNDDGGTIKITATRSTYVGPTQDTLAKTSEVTGKTDKVSSATSGNFAELDANGNLVDSGHKHSDYLTAHQDITGKQNAYDFSAIETISSAGTEQSPNEVTPVDAQNKRVSVEAANAYIAVALPAASANGHIRDFMLTLDCSTLEDGEEPRVVWASGYVGANGDADNLVADAAAVNVYYISEYAPNAFLVARQVIGGGL